MKKLLLALLGISSDAALACGGQYDPVSGTCRIVAPDGQMMYYNAPVQGYGSSAYQEPPPPQIQYYEVGYAAIAVNDSNSNLHWTVNANSPEEARKEVLASCQQKDGAGAACTVVFGTHEEFFSVTQGQKDGRKTFFFADGTLSFERSMADCQAAGMSDCEDIVIEGQPRRFL
ncbi:DUF4189 domain-containing protein [Cardiobacterium hominis]|uniref:DUF4189 domain-containing protein n=1 Tax=Cardiobacterium hominis TaxID=2718 RepID=UPI0028CFF192|nr:DUF4189 domain-containing protein [Cardiobacterium hominis]